MSQHADQLDLLLVDADQYRPVLEEGLPQTSADRAPKPKKGVRGDDSPDWWRADGDPNDLPEQRWGVVAPEGREGDRMLEAIQPLLRLREAEQGAKPIVFRVPPDMDIKQSVAWKDQEYWSENLSEAERPRYLLVMGDLHHISVELQHSLANGSLVGRLHCADSGGETDLKAYAAYAEKAVRFAKEGTPHSAGDMLFFVAPDGTSATATAENKLVAPSAAAMREGKQKGHYPYARLRELSAETVDDFLAAGAQPSPSVLMSVSHGLGPPRRGFKSENEQERRQGAMVLGGGEVLDAECLQSAPFLPGGLWFFLACFGAGTPSSSVYHTWLSHLAKEGAFKDRADAVLGSLPKAGQRPFMAAMPQAALANPHGPLAVLGHVDLAWTYGFSNAKKLSESRKSRILSALQVMLRGGRAGVALEALVRFYRETNDALMTNYQLEADALAANRPDPSDHVERGHLWMLRNDLRGYVLLGDPAVRLPLQSLALNAQAPRPSSSPPEIHHASGTARLGQDQALKALLQGDETPRSIAAQAGISLSDLWNLFESFRAGKRSRSLG